MSSSLAEAVATSTPKCAICCDIYDQELAQAFTARCGHSICAQCEFRLRIACIKKGIPSQCWICIQPFNGPLYRTYALESTIPRSEKQRFQNPYMTNSQLRQELATNSKFYRDISIRHYIPPTPPPSLRRPNVLSPSIRTLWGDLGSPYRPTVYSPFESEISSLSDSEGSQTPTDETTSSYDGRMNFENQHHGRAISHQRYLIPIVPQIIYGPAIVSCTNITYTVPPGTVLFYWEIIHFVTFLTPVWPTQHQTFIGPTNYFGMH